MYISPFDVKSPIKEIIDTLVIYDGGEGGQSAAFLLMEEKIVLGQRTNGTSESPRGMPTSSTHRPTWNVMDDRMTNLFLDSIIKEIEEEVAYHTKKIIEQYNGELFWYKVDKPISLAELNLLVYAIGRQGKEGHCVKVPENDLVSLHKYMTAKINDSYYFVANVENE